MTDHLQKISEANEAYTDALEKLLDATVAKIQQPCDRDDCEVSREDIDWVKAATDAVSARAALTALQQKGESDGE